MSNPTSKTAFTPILVTPDVLLKLERDGFVLPPVWPTPALAATEFSSAHGWTHAATDDGVIYTAPDGTKLTRSAHGKVPALVGLSTKQSPFPLVLMPGEDRPAWMPLLADARKAVRQASSAHVRASGSLALSDEALRTWMETTLDSAGEIGGRAATKLLRAEGYSAGGGRVRAMYATVLAARPKGTTPKPSPTKPKVAAKLTRPAPKPSAKAKGKSKKTVAKASPKKTSPTTSKTTAKKAA